MYDVTRLEYKKVLALLKDYCSSEYSQEKVYALQPSAEKEPVFNTFNRLNELENLIASGLTPHAGKVNDMRDMLARASVKRSFLSPGELAEIRDNLSFMAALKRQFASLKEEAPLLVEEIGSVRIPYELKERIESAVDEHSQLRDDASPVLLEIMNKVKGVRKTIENILDGYLYSPATKQYIQEKHITIKDDRYVIPVKQNFKGRIPGIVHAQSGSEKTVFVEPFSIVEKNNEIRLLYREREKEILNILISLTGEVRKRSDALSTIQEVLCDFDILMAKLNFMEQYGCCIPEFSEVREIVVQNATHPLIRGRAVPVDFRVAEPTRGVVITGPNTGGKTVSLKMIGLFVLLAQSGIPVPAKKMRSFFFSSVFSDIGDEGSIEQSLSTFSGHIKNIREIIQNADERSLVLIDELGAGTDPIEGGALGAAILDYLISRNILTVVTTHFSFIKMYALEHDTVEVASVEFDPETCRPTYRMIMGIPGRSNALEIARYLGLEKKIISKTEGYLGEEDRSIDVIFKNLALLEKNLSSREKRITRDEELLAEMVQKYSRRLKDLGRKERFLSSEYKKELSCMLSEYRKRLEKSIREIKEKQASGPSIKTAKESVSRIEEEFSGRLSDSLSNSDMREEELEAAPTRDFAVGDWVLIQNEDGGTVKGKIVVIDEQEVTVQAGSFRFSVNRDRIQGIKPAASAGKISPAAGGQGHVWDFSSARRAKEYECDIRGMRFDEAMNVLDRFLDSAVLNNLDTVYIIHGLGTGALRQGVWDTLKKFKYAEHFEYARPEQGGFGCTIVKLKS